MQSYSAHIVILTLFNTKPYYLLAQPPQIISRARTLERLLFSPFPVGVQGFQSLALRSRHNRETEPKQMVAGLLNGVTAEISPA